MSDIPTCRRIHLPAPLEENIEIRVRATKQKMMNVVTDYIHKDCDSKGNIKKSNMTRDEIRGLNECSEKGKSREQVYYMTDKSKMLSADSPSNYITAMTKHIEGDNEISDKELENI